jgi:hypothetical protein
MPENPQRGVAVVQRQIVDTFRPMLTVCRAMSMAMTVVLPARVASFSVRRISSGLASLLADARWSSRRLPFLDWARNALRPHDRGLSSKGRLVIASICRSRSAR